jgi:hypothetical protein
MPASGLSGWLIFAVELMSRVLLGAAILLPYIQDTRSMLASLNLPKTLPVGTADAGAFFNTKILQNVDYGVRVSYS